MGEVYVPIVAYLPKSAVEHLRPTVDKIAASCPEPHPLQTWTPEMVAWGRLLSLLAESGVEIDVAPNGRTV